MSDEKPILSAAQMRRATVCRAKAPPKETAMTYTIEGKPYTAAQAVAAALKRCKAAVKPETIRKRVIAGKKTWKELTAPPHGDRSVMRSRHEKLFKARQSNKKRAKR